MNFYSNLAGFQSFLSYYVCITNYNQIQTTQLKVAFLHINNKHIILIEG